MQPTRPMLLHDKLMRTLNIGATKRLGGGTCGTLLAVAVERFRNHANILPAFGRSRYTPSMPRAISSGTISFGLVSIPVKVFSSTEPGRGISFNLIHKKTGVRVKQQYIDPTTQEIVPRSEMVKGYEFTRGKYVTFTNEELKSFEEEANKAIAIESFVPEKEVDPLLYDKAYYLGPDKGGERAYALLRAAMRETRRVAVARFASRGRQYLVMLRPHEDTVVMQQLHFADEIRPAREIPTGDAEVKGSELQLAVQLVEQIAGDHFKADAYEDDVKNRIEAAIAAKVEGQEVTEAPTGTPKAQIIDLMDALKASLGEVEPTPTQGAPKKQKATTSKSRKRPPKETAKG